MKRLIFPLIVFLLLSTFAFLVFKDKVFKTAKAGLKVESIPQAVVFLDGEKLGETPYSNEELTPGEKVLRLVPKENELLSWETKIKLTDGTLAYVSRKFGQTEASSSAKIITLEKLVDKKATALSIVSLPDSCLVKLNGEDKGFTPLLLENLTEDEYEIVLTSPGFEEIRVSTRPTKEFRVNLNLKLAQKEEEESEEEEEVEEELAEDKKEEKLARPYVEIKETPTGWLRVRMGPTTTASEAARVDPGNTYPLLGEESGWYKIEYEKDKEGWISGQYAEKYE